MITKELYIGVLLFSNRHDASRNVKNRDTKYPLANLSLIKTHGALWHLANAELALLGCIAVEHKKAV